MHSKIFQISKIKVEPENYIKSSRYNDHWFTEEIADYTADLDEYLWEDNWEWLVRVGHDGLEIADGKLTILNKEKYFVNKFTEFQQFLGTAYDMTMNQFMNNNFEIPMKNHLGYEYKTSPQMLMERLYSAFDDKFGFYIDDKDELYGLTTFDSFMRFVKDGDVFYLGSVIDYHF